MATDNRRTGTPRTRAQREARHKREHPGTPLPPRGEGLKNKKVDKKK